MIFDQENSSLVSGALRNSTEATDVSIDGNQSNVRDALGFISMVILWVSVMGISEGGRPKLLEKDKI